MVGYQTKRKTPFYRVFSAIFSGINLFSIGVWVILPIKVMLGTANSIDDVTKFIVVTELSPVWVTIIASILWISSFAYVWRKEIFQKAFNEIS